MTREELIAAAKEKERRQQLIQQAIAKHEAEVNQLNAENNQGLLSKYVMPAVDYTARGLDYAGGLVRTAIADAALPAEQITGEDWQKALRGQALPSSEILKRSGVSEIATLSDALPELYSKDDSGLLRKGGWADPSARGALGLALDVVADPLTYFTLGASNLGKAGKLLKPGSAALESGGKAIYKSGLKRIDQEALKYGKEPVSDVLMKYGISGSADAIQKQMDNLAGALSNKQKGLLELADSAGVSVPMADAMKPAEEYISSIKATRDPVLQDAVSKLEDAVGSYKNLDVMPAHLQGPPQLIGVQQANNFKSSIYDSLPKGAWAESASGMSPALITGKKQQARGLKEAVEQAVDSIGKGDDLRQINDELGRILTTQDKAASEAAKEANKNAFTSVDAMIAGSNNPTMLAVKKAADLAKMTGPRTNVGKFLYEQGRGKTSGPVWDMLLRQAVIGANQEDQ